MMVGICVLLAAMVWVVFGKTLGDDFVNYDDNIYVFQNPHVTGDFNLQTVRWAFTHYDLFLWTPLTTISHMLDCRIFGLQPWGHHLTNVLLHGSAAVLLFLVLMQMTGAPWRSAFVAAVFAIHPLRVESVAWVAERKDVLCGVFFMLALAAYAIYVRRRSVTRYLLVALLFAIGLMAKQMIVTLPCVLLLLDYWPLKRFAEQPEAGRSRFTVFARLVLEKLPLFVLSAASCAQTLMAGKDLRAVVPVAHPFLLRTANALMCYIVYIFQMFWPAHLSVFYPYPAAVPVWEALGAFALLAAVSVAAFAWRGRQPALFIGWFWYLGMMTPVIGVIPLGREGHADRYTYLPQIGLYIALAWMGANAFARLRLPGLARGIAMGAVVAALGVCANIQVSYWKNDESLWTRAASVAPGSAFVQNNLGRDLESDGNIEGAMARYAKALELQPGYPEALNNMGNTLMDKGDVDAAMSQYEEALNANPGYPQAHNNLAHALLQKGQMHEAIAQFQRVIEIDPGDADAHNDLANTLLLTAQPDAAAFEYRKALDINPRLLNAQSNLGNILIREGNADEAIEHFQKALAIQRDNPEIQNNLAHLLATCPQASLRDGAKALELAQAANQATGDRNPIVLGTLAAAYAETRQFSQAVQTAQHALELADSPSDATLAEALRAQIMLYKAGKPFRDRSLANNNASQP